MLKGPKYFIVISHRFWISQNTWRLRLFYHTPPTEFTSNPPLFRMWTWLFFSSVNCKVLIHPIWNCQGAVAWSAVEAELVHEAERTQHAWTALVLDGFSLLWSTFPGESTNKKTSVKTIWASLSNVNPMPAIHWALVYKRAISGFVADRYHISVPDRDSARASESWWKWRQWPFPKQFQWIGWKRRATDVIEDKYLASGSACSRFSRCSKHVNLRM